MSVPPTTSAAYTSEYTRAFPSCCLETSPWSGSVSRNAHAGPERRSHRSSRDGRLTWRCRREAGRAQPEGAPYGPDPNGVQTPRFLSPAFDFLLALTGHPGTLSAGASHANANLSGVLIPRHWPRGTITLVLKLLPSPSSLRGAKAGDLKQPKRVPLVLQQEGPIMEAVTSVAFSPDGQSLASGSWKRWCGWDLRQPEAVPLVLPHGTRGLSVVFSTNGRTLASGSNDGMRRAGPLLILSLKKSVSLPGATSRRRSGRVSSAKEFRTSGPARTYLRFGRAGRRPRSQQGPLVMLKAIPASTPTSPKPRDCVEPNISIQVGNPRRVVLGSTTLLSRGELRHRKATADLLERFGFHRREQPGCRASLVAGGKGNLRPAGPPSRDGQVD